MAEPPAASPPPAPTPPGPTPLARLTATLGDLQSMEVNVEPSSVAVVAVERYLRDLRVPQEHGEHQAPQPSFAYDVTVTDGERRLKCSLALRLSHLVHTNRLKAGCELLVLRYDVGTAERLVVGVRFPVIADAEVVAERSRLLVGADAEALPWALGASCADKPLGAARDYYLPLWNGEDYYGRRWEEATAEDVPVRLARRATVRSLEEVAAAGARGPPLVVRLLHKSRLLHFGRVDRRRPWPYRVYLEVCDGTGVMPAVLWNELCPEWFRCLQPGQALVLRDYTLKGAFAGRTWPDVYDVGLPTFKTLEINLNSRHPAADIRVVHPRHVDPAWHLPEGRYRFTRRRDLGSLPADRACDVVGLVSYVGRQERIRKKDEPWRARDDFWVSRWVHAVDASSEEPFVLQLFATSQPDVHELLRPATLVVCTQMRVRHGLGGPYLTTSVESQVFVTGQHADKPYAAEPAVLEVARWCCGIADDDFFARSAVGGCYVFPPLPPTLAEFAEGLPTALAVTPLEELRSEMARLHYRERKRLVVQGTIAEVRFVELSEAAGGQENGGGHDAPPSAPVRGAEAAAEAPAPPSQAEDETGDEDDFPLTSAQVVEWRSYDLRSGKNPTGRGRRRQTRRRQKEAEARRRRGGPPTARGAQRPGGREPRERRRLVWAVGGDVGRSRARAVAPDDADHVAGDPAARGSAARGPDSAEALWETNGWSGSQLVLADHLRLGELPAEAVMRRYDHERRDAQRELCNLQPARRASLPPRAAPAAEAFRPACDRVGYFVVTLLGLDRKVALDVPFVPVWDRGDRRAACALAEERAGLLEILAHGSVPPGVSPLQVTESASPLAGQRMLFVLEQCRLGADSVEVTLNRAYPAPGM
uniref:LOW QUALITY PROTEIN: RPA-related protein RADX n=1 Tax=Petromyzon marinus TaxID=7757 RepID=A0AAJ7UE16_PETMA|nr:LOW QUALITY PROTEIN: RPA-related protein RADX [Petromyzon marinus]